MMTEKQMEKQRKGKKQSPEQADARFYSCQRRGCHTDFVKSRLKNYEAKKRDLVLRQTARFNDLMDEAEEHIKRLLKGQKRYICTVIRMVNEEVDDQNGKGLLAEITGSIEVGDDEGGCEGASLEVVLEENDDELQQDMFKFTVESNDGIVGPFNSLKEGAEFVVNLVFFLNKSGVNDHESHDYYEVSPTCH